MSEVLLGSFLSAFATGLGAIPVLFFKNMSHRWRDTLLAFAAGIMLAVTMFNLIPEALQLSSIEVVIVGVFVGAIVLGMLEKYVPHMDIPHKEKTIKIEKKTWLIVASITLHNLPEGMSVGVSYASEDDVLGGLIALSIGVQNMPEGFLVGLFLVIQGVKKWNAIFIATLTGIVEMPAAIFGYGTSQQIDGLVPFGLSFAAGAMLFIIYKELIPESHGDGNESSSTYAFIFGIAVLFILFKWFH